MTVSGLSRGAWMVFALVSCSWLGRADVTLPTLLASHIVLQRNQPIHLWGWAAPGESVTASLQGSTQTTVADRLGSWSLNLPPEPAGGPYVLSIKGTNTIQLEDVLIGDVWFASGQSNMEMPLKGFTGAPIANSASEIQNATQPQMRLFLVQKKAINVPQEDYPKASWTTCTPESAADFSAVAYFFGRDIAKQEHVPIGLIDSTWGGTPAEAWTSMRGLAANASLMPVFEAWSETAAAATNLDHIRAAEKAEDEAAKAAHQEPPKHPWRGDPSSWEPAALFNGMVAPALPFHIKGAIWYQGESNTQAARAPLYHKLFSTMIEDWRRRWAEGEFPFLFVQISSFGTQPNDHWGLVRDAQRRTLSLANTGMAVTTDIGDADNVHPADKQDVGARLALAARALAYGEQIEYSGPLFRQVAFDGNTARVWFSHAGAQLTTKGNAPLRGFEIAGEDGHFVGAEAHIDGATVVVSNAAVTLPRSVRYGWAPATDANLTNSDGLPASTFTSESELP